MGFHWGLGPSQINQVVALSGSDSAPTTASLLAAAKVEKKPSKASITAKPYKDKATSSTKRVIGFELVFTSSVTGAQLTVRIPAVGAFHDPKQRTALSHVQALGSQIATALNKGLHEPGVAQKKPRK
jgi:hypothetical protein